MPERLYVRDRMDTDSLYESGKITYYVDVQERLSEIDAPAWLSESYNPECPCVFCAIVRGFACVSNAANNVPSENPEYYTMPERLREDNAEEYILAAFRRILNVPRVGATGVKAILESDCTLCGGEHPVHKYGTVTLCTACYVQSDIKERTCEHCRESATYVGTQPCGDSELTFPNEAVSLCSDCIDEFGVSVCPMCNVRHVAEGPGAYFNGITESYLVIGHPEGHTRICWSCYNEHYHQCDGCSNRFFAMDDAIVEYQDGRWVCDDCTIDLDQCEMCGLDTIGDCGCTHGFIRSYGHKPMPVFRRTKRESVTSDLMYYGVELEYEHKGSCEKSYDAAICASALNKQFGEFMYAKGDSTLSDGVEFVTHPFTYSWFKENRKAFGPFFDALSSRFSVHSTCGMHVHLSRTKHGLKRSRLYKLCHLLYGHPFFTEYISGRYEGQLSSYGGISESRKVLLAKAKGDTAGHRGAVNCRPDMTIELRLFGAPKDYDHLLCTMETVEALVGFTKVVGFGECTPTEFQKYVTSHSKTFKHLAPHIAKYRG